jgi:hypothetical protein
MRNVINESSTFTARARLSATPLSLRYLIKDIDNDRIVRDWTTLAPAALVEFSVIASDNDIYNDRRGKKKRTESRVLTIQANYDTDTQFTKEIEYVIRNLRGFDS